MLVIFFFFWLVPSVAAGIIAYNKGHSGAAIFLLSLILSPLIGLIVALVLKTDVRAIEKGMIQTGDNKKCPYCAEVVKAEAIVCRYCGKDLPPPPPTTTDNKERWCEDCQFWHKGQCLPRKLETPEEAAERNERTKALLLKARQRAI